MSSIPEPYREYTVTPGDVAWVGTMATKPQDQAKLKRLPYADTWEMLAEKFHTDLDFMQELNPTLKEPPVAGAVVRVPDVEPFDLQAVSDLEKKRRDDAKAAKAQAAATSNSAATPTPTPAYEPKRKLVLLREPRLIELYEDDKLAGCFPCTPRLHRISRARGELPHHRKRPAAPPSAGTNPCSRPASAATRPTNCRPDRTTPSASSGSRSTSRAAASMAPPRRTKSAATPATAASALRIGTPGCSPRGSRKAPPSRSSKPEVSRLPSS
ncbi:MAG: hypothetical protein WDN28_24470 [Chthoniobacter sp.]